MNLAALLVPALRWDPAHGFGHLRDFVDDALGAGVGGFVIEGGTRDAVAALAADMHARSRVPLLLGADVERGAGQQFEGCIAFPPFGALGWLGDETAADAVRRAARTTARELRRLGLNWALAPVCDLDVEPGTSMAGTRAAGSDPARVGELVAEWIDACQTEGVLACAKHFPGQGRASADAPGTLPIVRARAGQLAHEDLAPFRAAIDAGVASAMTAHVAYPALDSTGAPATLSARIAGALLRDALGFEGLLVSGTLDSEHLLAAGAEPDVAVRAIAAGCDVLLAPRDVAGVTRALERAEQHGALGADRVRSALERRDRWAEWARSAMGHDATLDDAMWARQAADRVVHVVRGALPRVGAAVEVVTVADDAGPQSAAARACFAASLRALDVEADELPLPSEHSRVPVLVAVHTGPADAGRAALGADSAAHITRTLAAANARNRESFVVLFAHPRHGASLDDAPNVLCAWGGDAVMQAAAARVVVRGAR